MFTMPDGITGKSSLEVLNDGLGSKPSLDYLKRIFGATHYGFKVYIANDGYVVKGRPYLNWKERQIAEAGF